MITSVLRIKPSHGMVRKLVGHVHSCFTFHKKSLILLAGMQSNKTDLEVFLKILFNLFLPSVVCRALSIVCYIVRKFR